MIFMNRKKIILFFLIIAIFLVSKITRQNYVLAIESSMNQGHAVMHPDSKTMKIWNIQYSTAHTTTEKSVEEWFNNVKPYVEIGWWPSDPKDIQYLITEGYGQPAIDWKTSEEIIDKLNYLSQNGDKNKEELTLNDKNNSEPIKRNNKTTKNIQIFISENLIQLTSKLSDYFFDIFKKINKLKN